MPFAKSYLAIVAATRDAGRTALLLSAAQAIRKCVVGVDVIHLRGRLVVPTAPGLAAIDGYDRPLITPEQNHVRIVWIDPDVLVIIAAGRAAKTCPRLSTIDRFPANGTCRINDVGIFRIDARHG